MAEEYSHDTDGCPICFNGRAHDSACCSCQRAADGDRVAAGDDPENDQGLGLFARCGLTGGELAELRSFGSIGLQSTGLLGPCGADVLGIGLANGQCRDTDDPQAMQGGERVIELYYRMAVMPDISLSLGVQHVQRPGGRTSADDAFVFGLRARIVLE